MQKTLEVIEKGKTILHKGDDSFMLELKKGMIFLILAGRYEVLSVTKRKNHRKVMVKKLK